MPKIVATVTEEIERALEAEVEKRGATKANLLRQYVLEGLARDGHQIKSKVSWGGRREKKGNLPG